MHRLPALVTLFLDTLIWGVLGVQLMAAAWVDWHTHRIPNRLNAALLMTGLLVAGTTDVPGLTASIVGAGLGSAILLGVALAFRRLRGQDGLGLGDVKFLAGAGAWTGWQGVGPVIFLAAAGVLVIVGARRWAGAPIERHQPIPFGPALCVALLVVRVVQQADVGVWR